MIIALRGCLWCCTLIIGVHFVFEEDVNLLSFVNEVEPHFIDGANHHVETSPGCSRTIRSDRTHDEIDAVVVTAVSGVKE